MIPYKTYQLIKKSYETFNKELFNNSLPEVMFTLNRTKNAKGYFHAEQFVAKENEKRYHEISLNPELFNSTTIEILSTLVHEMVHLWQQEFGKPGKNGYHNKQWGKKMNEIGLNPISFTNNKGTGTNVSHEIVSGGKFEIVGTTIKGDFTLYTLPPVKKKTTRKTKYECPECEMKIYGKRDLFVICGDCDTTMQVID